MKDTLRDLVLAGAIFVFCIMTFPYGDEPFEPVAIPSVITSKVSDNEVLLQYGTNADNSVFFIETQNKETKDVFVRMWKDGVMIVNEQK